MAGLFSDLYNSSYTMMNPKNYDLQGLIHESDDKMLKVLKLHHKTFEKELVAKIYEIEDPNDLGALELEVVI